ncbi:MAG: hypothetical protein E6R04_01830 [Spirochaetes bacterium]|nr:MAG: hypothetical protein E6R04_01830 [Spirochaetota bacterium]
MIITLLKDARGYLTHRSLILENAMSINFPNSLDTFPNPSASSNLDASDSGNPQLKHSNQHQNLNAAMAAIESKLGINFSSSSTSIDFIINLLLMTQTEHHQGMVRVILGGPFPSTVTWYKDSGKTIKLIEKEYGYDGRRNVNRITVRLFDGSPSNVLKRTIIDDLTLNGPFETERVRTIS